MKQIVIISAATLLAGACFESGPLGTQDTHSWPPPNTDTQAPPPPQDTLSSLPDTTVTNDLSPSDTPGGLACLTNAECADLNGADKCAGTIACINYTCQIAPDTIVNCPQPNDPCIDAVCVPETGGCIQQPNDKCKCQPIDYLSCGVVKELSTADSGATTVLNQYACGEGDTSLSEHVWLFQAPMAGSFKIVDELKKLGGIRVIGYDGSDCTQDLCVGAGTHAAAFSSAKGATFAIVAEHASSQAAYTTLRLHCDVKEELDCGDGIDDDVNGLTDCADPSCVGQLNCPDAFEDACDDGIDNDGDGQTDCVDSNCEIAAWCTQQCPVPFDVSCDMTDTKSSADHTKTTTNYWGCNQEAGGYEVVYRFTSPTTKQVVVTLDSDVPSMGLFAIYNFGMGCFAKDCYAYDKKTLAFQSGPGAATYIAVDSAVNTGGTYDITFSCY